MLILNGTVCNEYPSRRGLIDNPRQLKLIWRACACMWVHLLGRNGAPGQCISHAITCTVGSACSVGPVPHGRRGARLHGQQVWGFANMVPRGSSETCLYEEAGSGLNEHGSTCCVRTSLGKRVSSGCSHACESTWDL
jgi:hypothetical protein